MIASEDWEDYFDPTKREMRREKRSASRADRSKYKKTDQDKLLERPEKELSVEEPLLEGRVLLIRSQEIHVFHNNLTIVCTLKGTLRQDKTKGKNLVIVGDIVDFSITQPGAGVIHKVHKRTSFLCRQDHLDRIKQQLIASNIDQLVILVAVNEPPFSPSLVDRYLIAARKGNMCPLIVINKWDLCSAYPEQAKIARESLKLYRSLGLFAINISVETGENVETLIKALQGKVSVFSGPSGSGKSRLLNSLTGSSLPVGVIRAIRKGSHTTSCAKLIKLPFGGWTVDTPGIRSLGIFELTKEDLRHEFAEIFHEACEFPSCSHTPKEHSCSVPKAVEEGKISPYRYLSYLSLLNSLEEPRKRR